LPDNIAINNIEASKISVYPNPVSDRCVIETAKPANLKVMSISGKILFEKSLENGKNYFSVENLSSGIYFLQISDGNTISTSKILKK